MHISAYFRLFARFVFVVGCLASSTKIYAQSAPAGQTATPVDTQNAPLVIFDGGLRANWQSWGWAHLQMPSGKPAEVQFNRYAGWIIGKHNFSGQYGELRFNVKAPISFGDFLEVHVASANDDSMPRIKVTAQQRHALPDGWEEVRIPMSELNPSNDQIEKIVLRAAANVGQDPVFIDKITLIPGSAEAQVAQAPVAHHPAVLRINCRAKTHKISPYIYGTAFVPRHADGDAFQWELGATIRRWGGNPASRYNWKLGNAWNTASDWFYKNVNYTSNPSYSWKDFLAENAKHHVTAAITVPMLGWVAKDTDSYSYPMSQYGDQKYHFQDAGNGIRKDGSKITAEPYATSIEATPEFSAAWVKALETQSAQQPNAGVTQYILDNEPALWNSTHRDVHPRALTYDELMSRTIAYGTQVRKAAPKAIIAGPAEWGWPGYFFSAKDAEAGFWKKPDRRAHGDVPLLNWYLRQLRAYEKKTGIRILDVVDVHYYPQTNGLYGNGERTDPKSAAARIRATRSLWDPTFEDESWIKEKIQLLPRLKSIIDTEYPGLKISLGEYNFGGEKHISGGLALAEALGRFGQAGIFSAYYWTYPPANSCAFHAFRAYRNYDGQGHGFLDYSLPTTADSASSLFASKDASGQQIVAVALNLDADQAMDAQIELEGCGDFSKVRSFVYTGGSQGLKPTSQAPEINASAVKQTLPPYSITVLELSR